MYYSLLLTVNRQFLTEEIISYLQNSYYSCCLNFTDNSWIFINESNRLRYCIFFFKERVSKISLGFDSLNFFQTKSNIVNYEASFQLDIGGDTPIHKYI